MYFLSPCSIQKWFKVFGFWIQSEPAAPKWRQHRAIIFHCNGGRILMKLKLFQTVSAPKMGNNGHLCELRVLNVLKWSLSVGLMHSDDVNLTTPVMGGDGLGFSTSAPIPGAAAEIWSKYVEVAKSLHGWPFPKKNWDFQHIGMIFTYKMNIFPDDFQAILFLIHMGYSSLTMTWDILIPKAWWNDPSGHLFRRFSRRNWDVMDTPWRNSQLWPRFSAWMRSCQVSD